MTEATSGALPAPPQTTTETNSTTGPPLVVLAVAGLSVAIGAALLLASSFPLNVVGYVLSSVVVILAVGVFRRVDRERRLSSGYRARPVTGRVIPVLLVLAFLVTAGHVWAIATELAS